MLVLEINSWYLFTKNVQILTEKRRKDHDFRTENEQKYKKKRSIRFEGQKNN